MSASAISPTNPVYLARKLQNRVLLLISCLALAFGLFWLAWILGTLLYEGAAFVRSPTSSSRS